MDRKPRAMVLASVASMIDLFNKDNIDILLKRGYEVDVVANFENGSITSQKRVNEFKDELIKKGITVYNTPIPRHLTKLVDIIRSYSSIRKIVNENDYKIVHCHSPIGGFICRLACIKARKDHETKVIYTAHGFHFFDGASIIAWLLFYPAEKYCSRFTDVLVTINHEDYQRAQKFHAGKVLYLPGIGVDTEAYKHACVNRDSKRREFDIKPNDFVFMSTGQLSVRKNHEVAIRALAKMDKPYVKYLIVGFGELENYLKKLADDLGIANRIVFTGYRGDVKELLHSVDAYIFPSLQEGLPVSLMEAMAAGLPVVCSRIRGNVDLIEDGKGGFIYDCHDVDGFAKGMQLIASGDFRDMGRINATTITKFDRSIVNKQMSALYEEMTDGI